MLLVDKKSSMMHIQVPAPGKTVIVPAAAAVLVDSSTATTTEEPPTTEPPSSTEPSKEQEVVSAAVAMTYFKETINAKDYPALNSKKICLETDKDCSIRCYSGLFRGRSLI